MSFVLSAVERRIVKDSLEVRAIRDSRMGISDRVVPAGSIGYVLAARLEAGRRVVFWPSIPRAEKTDWRTGDHPAADLEPTGNRG